MIQKTMEVKATINQSNDCWVLCLLINDQVIKSYTFDRLIEALDCACLLQIHVSNESDLPLNQYYKVG